MVASDRIPSEVLAYLRDLAAALGAARSDLIGVYLHGSAVLGGFRSASSDVDVLAVVGTVAMQQELGERIATLGRCPGTGLEMSVVTAATAAVLDGCRFEVHVNTVHQPPVIVTGAGRGGDPDLVLHCAVCRDRALAVAGPPACRVFGPVPRNRVLVAMTSELRWALDHAPAAYAVLNACRALRFVDDGQLCSKLDGGEWYLERHPDDLVVTAALASQRSGGDGPAIDDARQFVLAASREASAR